MQLSARSVLTLVRSCDGTCSAEPLSSFELRLGTDTEGILTGTQIGVLGIVLFPIFLSLDSPS